MSKTDIGKAIAYAKKHGFEIEAGNELIEISGYDSQIHNDAGGHLDNVAFDDHLTEGSAWREALIRMKDMISYNNRFAPDDCECGFTRGKG